MAQKNQLLDAEGRYQKFTCCNTRFKTDIARGNFHGASHTRGNALAGPVAESGKYTLWLEHVLDDKNKNHEKYWFMWYEDGVPKIPISGIINKADLCRIGREMTNLCDSST